MALEDAAFRSATWAQLRDRLAVTGDHDLLALDRLVDQGGQAVLRLGDAVGAHCGLVHYGYNYSHEIADKAIVAFACPSYTGTSHERGPDSPMTRLLGVDPGLRFTGWGVIEADGNRLRHIADGVIATDSATSVPVRLKVLHDALMVLLAQFRPDEAAIEETYVNRNGAATLKLGYARGVALLTPALAGVPVTEYAAKSVKLSVVGTGGAEKEQVQMMVRRLLPGAAIRRADAADALAVAICHAHHRSSRMAWAAAAAIPVAVTTRPENQLPQRAGSVSSVRRDSASSVAQSSGGFPWSSLRRNTVGSARQPCSAYSRRSPRRTR